MERRSWFRVAAGLKHFEHAVRDQKTAHNVAGGGDNRDGASTVDRVVLCSPASRIAPTTAMASSALVKDISGVCRSGDTRRITSKPIKPASMNTYRLVI